MQHDWVTSKSRSSLVVTSTQHDHPGSNVYPQAGDPFHSYSDSTLHSQAKGTCAVRTLTTMQHAASPSDAFSAALDPNLRPNTLGGIPGPAPFPIPGSAPGSGNVPTSPENTSNRLNDFASHILDREEPPHPLSFTGEAGLLEAVGHFDPVGQAGQHEHEHSDPSKRDREDEVDMAVRLATENVHDGGVYEHDAQHYRHDHDHEHEHGLAHPDDLGNGHGHGHELDGGDDGMTGQEMMPAYPGRRKRRKGNEKDEHGMPLDPISMKKESHVSESVSDESCVLIPPQP